MCDVQGGFPEWKETTFLGLKANPTKIRGSILADEVFFTVEKCGWGLKKLTIQLPNNPEISLLGIHPKKL